MYLAPAATVSKDRFQAISKAESKITKDPLLAGFGFTIFKRLLPYRGFSMLGCFEFQPCCCRVVMAKLAPAYGQRKQVQVIQPSGRNFQSEILDTESP